ncbi:MAG TPA: glutaredoxin family protein [Burkholderiales bacterium]|nr:glutaredoxin family protein [Burkholderiales bacterium]
MIVRLLTVCGFAFAAAAAVAADTYRWEDGDGNVYYSNELPPAEAQNIRRPQLYGESSEQVLPYRLQMAVSRFPVTLYVTDCGPHCDMARELLVKRGVPHTVLDATSAAVQEELMTLTSGNREVPVIKIGRSVIRGFEAGQWDGALDVAGYPSYAIIDVAPTVGQLSEKAARQEGDADASDADQNAFEGEDTEFDDAEFDDAEDAQ